MSKINVPTQHINILTSQLIAVSTVMRLALINLIQYAVNYLLPYFSFHSINLVTSLKTQSMELKSSVATVFLLFLVLSSPCVSRGGTKVVDDPEVYEIDYRGPETHSSLLPPPVHSHRWPSIRRGGPVASAKSQGSRDVNARESVREHIP
ncbi:hypothetical protein K2173_019356 [Erythroxylum novogranatense]|uniref:Transmembrane protein n=1 Tax=Erythroxylum novogranatense TaxID=1862640 RepID=A0AAV8UB61_9ROSI|nr:hypothetical protein K2173_019356 [Erythroxylum novogranatense]